VPTAEPRRKRTLAMRVMLNDCALDTMNGERIVLIPGHLQCTANNRQRGDD
jgi:hypothetical protein